MPEDTGGEFERLEIELEEGSYMWEQKDNTAEPARICQVTLTDARNIIAALSLYISEMEGVFSDAILAEYRATKLQYEMLVNDMHKYGKEVRYE